MSKPNQRVLVCHRANERGDIGEYYFLNDKESEGLRAKGSFLRMAGQSQGVPYC